MQMAVTQLASSVDQFDITDAENQHCLHELMKNHTSNLKLLTYVLEILETSVSVLVNQNLTQLKENNQNLEQNLLKLNLSSKWLENFFSLFLVLFYKFCI